MYPGFAFETPSLVTGVVIIVMAGLLSGIFVFPTQQVREWDWEHIWFVYSLAAFLLSPLVLCAVFCPTIFHDVVKTHLHLAARIGTYGLLFGVGNALFGVCWARLGIALATALVSGVIVLVGSMGPVVLGAVNLDRSGWYRLVLGIVPLLVGLFLCAIASMGRDRNQGIEAGKAVKVSQSLLGIILAFASGLLSAMLNIGFSLGASLETTAAKLGYSATVSTLAVWIPVFAGGFVANFAYPAFLIQQQRSWGTLIKLQNSLQLWSRSLLMGVLWASAIFIYGYGAWIMGERGTTYGWAIVSGAGILGSLLLGTVTGEWRNSGRRPKFWMALSVVAIVISFIILSLPPSTPHRS